MPLAETATAVGFGLQALSSLFGGDQFKKLRKRAQELLYGQIVPGLQTGITDSEIRGAAGSAFKAASPFINRVAGSASAKFGSRSGLTLGAGATATANAISPVIAQLFRDKIGNRQVNLRTLTSLLGQHSLASK